MVNSEISTAQTGRDDAPGNAVDKERTPYTTFSRSAARKRLVALVPITLALIAVYPALSMSTHVGSNDFHAVIEMAGGMVALIAGYLLLTLFYSHATYLVLFIGLAYVVNGATDILHGLLPFAYDHNWITAHRPTLEHFIPGTYVAGRLLLGMLLIFAPFASRWLGHSVQPRREAVSTSIITGIIAVTVMAMITVAPLQRFIFPDQLISRPIDFLSALLLAGALGVFVREFLRTREILIYWILVSIAINLAGQILISFSKEIHDPFFDVAHAYKIFGYLAPVIGMGLYAIAEALERRRIQGDLETANEFLEYKVKDRTEELIAANRTLSEKEEHVRLLLEATGDGIIAIDQQGLCMLCNPAALHQLDITDESLILGQSAHDVFHHTRPDGTPSSAQQWPIFKVLNEGISVEKGEDVFWRPDGTSFPVEYHAHPIRRNDVVIGAALSFNDICARQAAQKNLSRANLALRTISAANQAMVHATSERQLLEEVCRSIVEQGHFRFVWVGFAEDNPEKSVRIAARYGHEQGYLDDIHISWGDVPEGRGPTGTAIRTGKFVVQADIASAPNYKPWREKALARGFKSSIALPLRDRGVVFGALNIYASQKDSFDDNTIALLTDLADDLAFGVLAQRDAEWRKRAEEKLRANEQRFSSMAAAAQDAFIMIDNVGNVSFWNSAAVQMFGYDVDEVVGRPLHDLVAHEADRPAWEKGFAEFTESGKGNAIGKTLEVFARRKDGGSFPAEVSVSAFQLSEKWHAVGIVRDITERKRSEEAFRDSEARFRSIFDQALDGILIANLTPPNQFLMANNAMCEMLGYSEDEVKGLSVKDIHPPDDLPVVVETFQRQARQEIELAEKIPVLRKDGSVFFADIRASRISIDGHDSLMGVFRDITERLEAENIRLQHQRMDSLGSLAGGVAHDINNMLMPIISLTPKVMNNLPEGSRDRKTLEMILKAAQRMKDMAASILAFSRDETEEVLEMDLRVTLEESLEILRSTLPSTIYIQEDLETEIGAIRGNPKQIEAMVMNLASNAADAMDGKNGTFSVTLDQVEIDSTRAQHAPSLTLGPYAHLRVSDTGCGMDEGTMKRIFDPLFTTKGEGKGTGLGLAMVFGAVSKANGLIEVSSVLGEGTTFDIYFPIASPQP